MDNVRIRRLNGLSNLEFMRRFARPGSIGLFGGSSRIDRAIRDGQRKLEAGAKPSLWSHAAVFQGERIDGWHWLIESDFEVGRGQLRNGVQENRVDKYDSEKDWPNLAILDFGLDDKQRRQVVVAGLELVARHTHYALAGVLETYWAMVRKKLDKARRSDSTFCSAFVRVVYNHAGVDLAPGIAEQHTLPEHVSRTRVPHTRHELVRDEI